MLPLTATFAADGGTHATTTAMEQATPAPVALPMDLATAVQAADPPQDVKEPAPADRHEPPPPSRDRPEPDPCSEALDWVAEAGLTLPPGVGYHCPSTQFSHHGAACWQASPCGDGGFIAINLELMGDATPAYLRHVVAHEICHILDFQARGVTTEAGADACAAAHGA